MAEYIRMWLNFANFSDRTNLRGFWMAILFNFIISGVVLGFIIYIIPSLGFLSYLYSLAVFLPSLALCIRRLRDAGKEWYYIFLPVLPILIGVKTKGIISLLLLLIGLIILIILFSRPSVADNGAKTV